jgi:hypothetical protein
MGATIEPCAPRCEPGNRAGKREPAYPPAKSGFQASATRPPSAGLRVILSACPPPALPRFTPSCRRTVPATTTSFYIQQRTALFAGVAALCSAAGIVAEVLSDVAEGQLQRQMYLYFAVANLSLVGLWLFSRARTRASCGS